MAEVLRCPSCYLKLAPTDFQCPRCELLLEGRLDEPPPAPKGEVSIVRALMERPQGTVNRKRPAPPPELTPAEGTPTALATTMEFRIPLELNELTPRVVANLTMTDLSLTPFEAFVVWSIDGKTRADRLLPILGLGEMELLAVLSTLESRGAISLAPPAPPAKKAQPPPPPPQSHARLPAAPKSTTAAKMKAAPREPPVLHDVRSSKAERRGQTAGKLKAAPKAPAPKRSEPEKLGIPSPAAVVAQKPQETDQRVHVADGIAKNRKILDALKQVKPASMPAAPRAELKPAPTTSASDMLAESALQVAIRMEQDGRIGEAVRYLERSIARSPDAAPLLNRLAIVLVRDRRDYAESERLLRRALELSPDHEVYKKNLVMVLAQAARENTGRTRRR